MEIPWIPVALWQMVMVVYVCSGMLYNLWWYFRWLECIKAWCFTERYLSLLDTLKEFVLACFFEDRVNDLML